MVPKLEFKVAKIEEYISIITFFILRDSRWKEQIFLTYPSLKERLENSKNPAEDILNFFKKQEEKFMKVIESIKNEFQKSWSGINDLLMIELEKINETRWDEENFVARVTLNPICPRYLNENMFDLYFGMAERTMRTICLHELSHFIFFKKLKEILPEIKKEEFESPYLIWKLSEIIPVILEENEEINKLFEVQEEVLVYESIRKLEINNKRVTNIIKEIYNSRNSFEDFVKNAYSFVQEHEKEIKF